jgi:hypothetical protein
MQPVCQPRSEDWRGAGVLSGGRVRYGDGKIHAYGVPDRSNGSWQLDRAAFRTKADASSFRAEPQVVG